MISSFFFLHPDQGVGLSLDTGTQSKLLQTGRFLGLILDVLALDEAGMMHQIVEV